MGSEKTVFLLIYETNIVENMVMNILYVTGMFFNNRHETIQGGMVKAVFMNAYGMQERGHHVTILTVDSKDSVWKYKGIRVVSVQTDIYWSQKSNLFKAISIVEREWKLEKKIRELAKQEKIDVIQYTGWFGIGLFHAKIPAIMRISSYTKAQLSSCYSRTTVSLLSFFERCAARRMNAIYGPSNIMAKALEDDIRRKVYVIETPFVKEDVEEDDFFLRTKLNDKKYVLFFSRLSEDKGIGIIRDCIYDVLKRYDEIYFVFAGGGKRDISQEILSAAKECKNRVIFLGSISHEKLYPVIRKAEIILMPSLKDNFPNSCAEAMSLHKIVIGAEDSSLEQFITDGYNGFLIQNGSSDSLKNKIEHVLQMTEKDKKIICSRTQEKINELDPQKYFTTVENLMRGVIEREKRHEIRRQYRQ